MAHHARWHDCILEKRVLSNQFLGIVELNELKIEVIVVKYYWFWTKDFDDCRFVWVHNI